MVGTIALKRVKRTTTYKIEAAIIIIGILIFVLLYIFNRIPSTVLSSLPGFKDTPPRFAFMIYGQFGDLQMNKPMDVTVSQNKIYISDTNNHRVQVFDMQGKFLYTFGKRGNGKGEFQFPYGIAGDDKGNIYVGDMRRGNVSVFDTKGNFKGYAIKSGSKLLSGPGDIAIRNNKLYITDIKKSKILVYNMQTKQCELEIKAKNSELKAPNGIAVDEEGQMYVVDTGHDRVIVLSPEGKFTRVFNGSKDGAGNTVFSNPRGIGIDSKGRILVVSNLTNTIYGFDEKGKQMFNFGGMGNLNNQFSLPNGLFIDEDNRVYITDTSNQRVAVYQ